ncbi:MAG: hypothetical protein ACE5OZ_14820 [Candidatus Heimdallarchaeota archaeon]
MTSKPPEGATCTCGCGSKTKNLTMTVDKKRWFVDKDHVITYIRRRESDQSKVSGEKKAQRVTKKARKRAAKKPSKKKTTKKTN